MAGFFSEVTAKLGVDTTAFKRGMTESVAVAGQAAGQITKKFQAQDIGRTLATALGFNLQNIADKLVEPFKESADAAERIAQYSETAANATQRLLDSRKTDLQLLADMERRLEKLMKTPADAGQGGFIERMLGRFANPMTSGPLAGLFSYFDTSTDRQSAADQKRAAEINTQNLAVQAKRAEIEKKNYDEALRAEAERLASIEKQNKAAQTLAAFRKQQQLAEMPVAERLAALRSDQAEIESEISDFTKQIADGVELTEYGNQRLLELEQKRADTQKQIADETKTIAENAKNLAESYYRAQIAAQGAAKSLATAKQDALSASLGELASGAGTGTQQFRAQEIMRLEAQAKRQNLMGFADLATQSQERALAIRAGLQGLSSGERSPFMSLEKELKDANKNLGDISRKLDPTSIN